MLPAALLGGGQKALEAEAAGGLAGDAQVGDGGAGKVVVWAPSNNGKYAGPGHNSVFQDDAGDYWLFYHAYTKDDGFSVRHLMMDKLLWDEDGWPYVHGEGKFKPSYHEELDGPRFFDVAE